jgi:DNA-binding transcriptional regulator LsrR (DeoR family)
VRLAERTGARHYPMALPVYAATREEVATLHAQTPVAGTLALCARADVLFVGVAGVALDAPMAVDGFVPPGEVEALRARGAVGEIIGRAFDAGGRLLRGGLAERAAGAPLEPGADRPVIAVALGPEKVAAIRAALRGCLVNGLVTDERTADALLGGEPGA